MAYALMLFGLWDALTGNVMGGVWLVLIALFIRNAARMGYRQHVMSRLEDATRTRAGPRPPQMTGTDVTDLRPSER